MANSDVKGLSMNMNIEVHICVSALHVYNRMNDLKLNMRFVGMQ